MTKNSKRKELMDRLIREEVVKTVLDLIEKDYQITMDEVAFKCGVAKGTLYNYFKNKKALLTFVHESVLTPMKERTHMIFQAPVAPMEKIHNFVDDVFNFHKEYPMYFKFIQSQQSAAKGVSERMDLTVLPLVRVCKEGIQKGQFVDMDPYAMAGLVFGTVIGAMESLPYREKPLKDLTKLKDDIICLLDRLLLKEQEKLL